MTDKPDENLTLETPREWARQGEERAERQWAASHPAKPIEPPKPGSEAPRWRTGAAMLALIMTTLALGYLAFGPKAVHHQPHTYSIRSKRATISNPAPGPTTTLTAPTAKTTLTSCSDNMVAGTLTNTSSRTQTFLVGVYVAYGTKGPWVWAKAGTPKLLGIAPGQTVPWASPIFDGPTGPVTCSLLSVLPVGG
jgi:hypothetical protein